MRPRGWSRNGSILYGCLMSRVGPLQFRCTRSWLLYSTLIRLPNMQRHYNWGHVWVEPVQPAAELRYRFQRCGAGGYGAIERYEFWLQRCNHLGYAVAQREPASDCGGLVDGHVQGFQCRVRQSNTLPSNVPRATTYAIRSSGGRLNATSNGTPFRIR